MHKEEADIAWLMLCSALIFLMVPGVTFLYGSGVQIKNRLSIMIIAIVTLGIAYVQWFVIGYSLAFDDKWGLKVIGGLNRVFSINLGKYSDIAEEGGNDYINFLLNLSGVGIATCLIVGGSAERSSPKSVILYTLCWIPLVYCPLIYMSTNTDGILYKLEYNNFTAGIPNLAIGVSALCYSYMLGKRRIITSLNDKGRKVEKDLANRITFGYLGTFLVWFTWFGLVGAGTGGANVRTVISLINMNISAITAGLTQMVLGYFVTKTKMLHPSQFCTGLVAGLLSISPAAGLVRIEFSFIFGFFGGAFSVFGTKLKHRLDIDEPTGIFETHGMGSFVGILLTGIFASTEVSELANGPKIAGGMVNGNFKSIFVQILGCIISITLSIIMSLSISSILKRINWCKFRIDEKEELRGQDVAELQIKHHSDATMMTEKDKSTVIEDLGRTLDIQEEDGEIESPKDRPMGI